MLPNRFRLWLFDRLSTKTMRYVSAVPRKQATGLTKRVYDMIEDDFFINGSLTSRSRVPELMAAIWTSGRETMLVDDHLDRTTKEAICGVLSDLNDCPYCGDMLISLVDAGKEHDAASAIYKGGVDKISDPKLRKQLEWVYAVGNAGEKVIPPCPFTAEELPEVLGSLMAMADINRFSHVVMDGSPVKLPFGLQRPALRMFGRELVATKRHAAEPGRALELLPRASLPADLKWAQANPRIADTLARWTAAVERGDRRRGLSGRPRMRRSQPQGVEQRADAAQPKLGGERGRGPARRGSRHRAHDAAAGQGAAPGVGRHRPAARQRR